LSCSDMIFHMNYLLLFFNRSFPFFKCIACIEYALQKTREINIDCWKFLKVNLSKKRICLKETKKFRNLC